MNEGKVDYIMKKLQILGVAIVAIFAFGVVSAGSAFALESVILVSGAKATKAEPVNSANIGSILFEDMTEEIDVTCTTVTDTGTVGPGKEDHVTTVTISGCSSSGCTGTPTVKAVKLPWKTEVVLSGSVYLDLILSGGSGKPGYEVTCVKIISIKDTCETENGTTILTESSTSGDLQAEFPEVVSESEEAVCSFPKTQKGLVVGRQLILSTEGLALTLSEA